MALVLRRLSRLRVFGAAVRSGKQTLNKLEQTLDAIHAMLYSTLYFLPFHIFSAKK